MVTIYPPGLPTPVEVSDDQLEVYLGFGWRRTEAQQGDEVAPEADKPTPPPHGGPGSSKTAWAKYAAAAGVTVPADADRDAIIAACEAADVPTE